MEDGRQAENEGPEPVGGVQSPLETRLCRQMLEAGYRPLTPVHNGLRCCHRCQRTGLAVDVPQARHADSADQRKLVDVVSRAPFQALRGSQTQDRELCTRWRGEAATRTSRTPRLQAKASNAVIISGRLATTIPPRMQ